MDNQTPYQYLTQPPLAILNGLIAFVGLLCVGLGILIFAGYGTLRINIPTNATIDINGHQTSNRLIKLRPGSYQVIVSSPTTTPKQDNVRIGVFNTVTYSPSLQPRNPDAIVSSLIGANGQAGAPQLGEIKWFDNNTWLVGVLVPGGSGIAVHYDTSQSQWSVAFYNADSYPKDIAKLPTDVAAYISGLGNQDVQR